MKKLLFSLFTLLIISSLVQAQETDPKKALSKAGRSLGAYNLDPANNENKLQEAAELIQVAADSPETNGEVKTWQTRGEVYNSISDNDLGLAAIQGDENFVPKRPDAPYIAGESFLKALELAQKKYEKKDALKGLEESARKLNQIGNIQIRTADYSAAFKSLEMVLKINNMLVENGETAVIPEADMNNHKFVLAYCAQAAGNQSAAKQYFKELYETGNAEGGVYAQYFNILNAEGDPNAIKVLEEGRAKYPDNSEILFAEINYYILKQDYVKLEEKLKKAIETEPNNPSVYAALGNVYMNLFTEAFREDMKSEKAASYFGKSKDYFEQSLKIDPKLYDAVYGIGSLYFNRAVELLKYANDLPMDKSKEYNAALAEAKGLMEEALPFFQHAESMNPNDVNTLIALSEIYARMDDLETSGLFKKRLESVRNGEKHDKSYFDK